MLTAELVQAQQRGGELKLKQLRGRDRVRAIELAQLLLSAVETSQGKTRDEVREALGQIDVLPRERRLADGLCKLIDDACVFDEAAAFNPPELRREVFRLAASYWRGDLGVGFERKRVLAEVAERCGLTTQQIEEGLFADLRGAQKLLLPPSFAGEQLVGIYEQAQVQAVLLRAVKIAAVVTCHTPLLLRALFRKLKFHRLLYTLERIDEATYRLEIDGPISLFEASTKYGLQMALVLPVLESCDVLELEAEVRWGKQRQPAKFYHRARRAKGGPPVVEAELPEAVQDLWTAFARLDTRWTVSVADDVLDLPGAGLCVPDLVFRHPDHGFPIYLEVLGFWSREAVWRRVELVEAGLPHRILFAVSKRLRVSEAVLGEQESGALHVFKGSLSARAIERKLNELARR